MRPLKLLDYEHVNEPVISTNRFFRRLGVNAGMALALIAASLVIGMIGYRGLAGLDWLDAFLNAAMILSGMGEVAPLTNPWAKLFAGIFALYSGLMLIATAGLIFAPVIHRLMHRLHVRQEEDET